MRGKRSLLLVIAAATGIAGAASAHDASFLTTIDVLNYTGSQNHMTVIGEVTSPKHRCETDRTVRYHLYFTGTFEFQGKATTNDNGRFKLKDVDFRQHGVNAQGDRAKATRRVLKHGSSRHICESAVDTNG